ncbi:MAG: thiolase family protein [Burkholderiaceae bacterium]|nr:thiolase family protein [Burkholderiaceae bacterium]
MVNTVCQVAAKRAFGEAGLSPGDVDVAEIYDSFTITAMIQLEEIGFCAKGEGGSFVEDGNIELGGALPLNTHGGLLSCAHPGVPGGLLHMVEAVTQLRGGAGERQVSGACVALCTNASAVASNFSMALLGREPR